MKTSTILAVVAASLVSAQGIDQIPECALSCAISSLGQTGCPTTDIACICKANTFIESLIPCVVQSCNTPELYESAVQAAGALCLEAGVTLTVQPPSSTTGPTVTDTATLTTTSAETTETSVETSTETETDTAEPTTSAPSPTGNNTEPTTSGPPTPTGTDDSSAAKNAIALGGVALAMIAALL